MMGTASVPTAVDGGCRGMSMADRTMGMASAPTAADSDHRRRSGVGRTMGMVNVPIEVGMLSDQR
jgi:hypothetical protein